MDIMNSIITWAKSQPLWQQVAIADLINVKEIDDSQIANYVRMAKLEISSPSALSEEIGSPLEDLETERTEESIVVQLKEVEATQNINLIADGSVLPLEKEGLNLIYGNNAAGKSGYTRILKNTCNCRHSEDIKGSADRPHTDECRATVRYEVNGSDEVFEWSTGVEKNAALQTIHVFDEKSSNRFIAKENDIKYMPLGMDVLSNLATIISSVAVKLKEENDILSSGLTDFDPIFSGLEGTQAYSVVSNLAAKNAKELHDQLKVVSEKEKLRIIELEKSIPIKESKSPSTQRQVEVTLLARLKGIQQFVQKLRDSLEKDNFETAIDLIRKVNAANQATSKARELEFDSESFLDGTGDDSWKMLWKAAKEYSETVAYPGHEHPYTGDEAKCVLCQQPILPEASERMQAFDAFVSDRSQEIARQAKTTLDRFIDTYTQSALSDSYIADLSEIISEDEYPAIEELSSSLKEINTAHEAYRLKFEALQEDVELQDLSRHMSNLDDFNGVINEIDLKHKTPLDDKKYEEELEAERKELRGLQARVLLESHDKTIQEDIESYSQRIIVNSASRLASTTSVSSKIGVLSNDHVVANLAKVFNEELIASFSGKVKAELKRARTDRGVPYCEIVLTGTNKEYKGESVQSVLSEGEQKVVALAGFFAELSQSPAKSAIVFDDPVTSLDNTNLRKIARRIARAASDRQVIVFTHNIVFANELEDAIEKLGDTVKFKSRSIFKFRNSGIVKEGLDFDNMNVVQRIDLLQKSITPIKAKYDSGNPSVKGEVVSYYRNLRITWERAIEEVLFNRTIIRYRRDIKPSSLKDVIIEQADKDSVFLEMEKCAQYVHDLSDEAGPVETPEPNTLKADLEELKKWIVVVKDRRKVSS